MSTFIGEIKLCAGDFAPRGWLLCQGQILPATDYAGLVSLLGSRYGGNGNTTFGLPDLRGRTPIGTGSGPGLTPRVLGQSGGAEDVALQQTQMPPHNHIIANTPNVTNGLTVTGSGTMKCASVGGNTTDPSSAFLAKTKAIAGDNIYTTDGSQATSTMNSAALDIKATLQGDIGVTVDSQCGMAGAGLEHQNMQPWLCLNYIINWDGVYPSRS
jgi:microcystin-dependent protein